MALCVNTDVKPQYNAIRYPICIMNWIRNNTTVVPQISGAFKYSIISVLSQSDLACAVSGVSDSELQSHQLQTLVNTEDNKQ